RHFFFQAEDGIRDFHVTGVQTCALPISHFKATVWNAMKLTGANASPFDAWLTYQGMKTLALRMDRHCHNAQQIAETLQAHPGVRSEERRVGKGGRHATPPTQRREKERGC